MVVFFADRLLKLKKYRTQSMKTSQPSNIPSKTKVHRHLPLGFSPSVSVAACYLEIGGKLLLLLRAKEKSEGGKWGVPAGKIEANEEPIDAALRELREETGIIADRNCVEPLGCLYVQKPLCAASQSKIEFSFHMFKVSISEMPKVQINQEHQAHRWAAAHEIETMELVSGGKEAYRYYCSTQQKNRSFSIVSGYLILQKEDTVLLGLRQNTGYCDGMWALPAGHVEDGEPATEALAREAYEEIGIQLDPKKLQCVHVIHRQSNRLNVDLFFTCSEWTGEVTNEEPAKCQKLQFFPLSALPENCIGYNRMVLDRLKEGTLYSELGWD